MHPGTRTRREAENLTCARAHSLRPGSRLLNIGRRTHGPLSARERPAPPAGGEQYEQAKKTTITLTTSERKAGKARANAGAVPAARAPARTPPIQPAAPAASHSERTRTESPIPPTPRCPAAPQARPTPRRRQSPTLPIHDSTHPRTHALPSSHYSLPCSTFPMQLSLSDGEKSDGTCGPKGRMSGGTF